MRPKFICDSCKKEIPLHYRLRVDTVRRSDLKGKKIARYDLYFGDICLDCYSKIKEGRLNEIIVE
jgi:hypothetical protein